MSGRVVKAVDLSSTHESGAGSIPVSSILRKQIVLIVQWIGHFPSKEVTWVRFPVRTSFNYVIKQHGVVETY